MLTVLKHGNRISVKNPVNFTVTEMINVVFEEKGRSGAIASMSDTSDFLSRLTGQSVGLDQVRVHTHPIKADKIGLFPLGKEIPGHINRKLFSTPQLRQQEGVESRMVDGKPTYFTTYLDDVVKPDQDYRMANETLAIIDPEHFRNSRAGTAEVSILETVLETSAEVAPNNPPQGTVVQEQQPANVGTAQPATVGTETLAS